MKTKIICMALSVMIAFSMTGCGNNEANGDIAQNTATTQSTVTGDSGTTADSTNSATESTNGEASQDSTAEENETVQTPEQKPAEDSQSESSASNSTVSKPSASTPSTSKPVDASTPSVSKPSVSKPSTSTPSTSTPAEPSTKPSEPSVEKPAATALSASEVFDKILSGIETPKLLDMDADMFKDKYGLDASLLDSYVVKKPMMSTVASLEYAVFKVKNVNDVSKIVDALNKRGQVIEEQEAWYPAEKDYAANRKIVSKGNYAILMITDNVEAIVKNFDNLIK